VSVGRTTGRPSPIASTASSTRRSSVDNSLTSCEIFPDRDLLVAEAAQQAGHRSRLAVGHLEGERASADETARRLGGDGLGRAGLDQGGARLVLPDLGRQRLDILGRHVGRVGDDKVERPFEAREKLALEVADGQAGVVAGLLRGLGYEEVTIGKDLAGRERVVDGRAPR